MNVRKTIYNKIQQRKTAMVCVLLFLVVLLFLADILLGPSSLSIADAVNALLHPSESSRSVTIIWSFRFPSAVMAVLVGASLAVAGCGMQTILGNPLASPFTLGASSAAGFGAALALTGHALVPLAGFDVCINAFLFTLICTALVYFIARYRARSAEVLVLAGIAMMFLFNSAMAVLQYLASEEELQSIVFWMFGSLSRAGWIQSSLPAAVLFLCIPVLIFDAWKLSALRLGESRARSLGINVEALRFRMIVISSLLTAAAICFVGTIAFIGLVAPHIARLLVGEDQRNLLPCSALIGAVLLSTASIIGELIVPTVILPIGVVTSFIGAPVFIFLILKFKKELL